MPLLDQLKVSAAVKIARSTDFDQFRSIEQLGDARSIPLELRNFASSSATVMLKSSMIYLQRTFPRILQQTYRTDGALVVVSMDDAVSVVLNGVQVRPASVLLVRGIAPCEIIEQRANLFAIISFDNVGDRDWPAAANSARLILPRSDEVEALRAMVRDLFVMASESSAFAVPGMVDQLEETLLQAVDRVMHAVPEVEERRVNLSQYLALVRALDELIAFNASRTLYSADIARDFGVSVRTLHNAVTAIRGMSLHRYVRLKRLWSVRQQLATGPSAATIKAIALANGFWHMGEFASLYRTSFGETPQQTLAAARGRKVL